MDSMCAMRFKFYEIARRTFWLLPGVLRSKLHGARHALVRWFRSRARHAPSERRREGDLNWLDFQSHVLSSVVDYRNVLIFEPNVDWGIALFQRPQHMAIALGRLGFLIIYKTTDDNLFGFRRVEENVWLANDPMLNSFAGAWRCFYSTSMIGSADALRSAGQLGPVIYEYIDHIDASISGGKAELRRLQELKRAALEGGVDLVIASAASLYAEAVALRGADRCIYVPNGVDVDHYQDQRHVDIAMPDSLIKFRNTYSVIVGYFGAIAPWLWYEMIEELTAQMPDVGFVFIGPDYSGCVPQLPSRDNVHYAGAVEYSVLPAYARTFDICCIPFVPGEVARSTSPLKLFEYFALEKPVVVTTDMNECTVFPEVFSGCDAASFGDAIRKAMLMRDDAAFKTRLRMLANTNSWTVRARTYSEALAQVLRNDRNCQQKRSL